MLMRYLHDFNTAMDFPRIHDWLTVVMEIKLKS